MSDGQAPIDSSGSSTDSTAHSPSSLPPATEGDRGLRPLTEENTVISGQPPVPIEQFSQLGNPFETGKSLLGKRLDHFELEEFIGGGGMGAVLRAKDTQLGRAVAVKVLSQDQADGDGIRRFRNEAQSAARLDHRNIARVHHVGEDQGWHFIVFEYIQGVNIRDVVDHKGPLPLNEAVAYVMQVAEALDHASARDVVHRDIKPSNLIVMDTGQVKLVDMGLARIHDSNQSNKGTELTVSGVTLGTFDYISPEQARDPRATDVRSDIYSLGCTFYYMLVGMPPFPDGTGIQKLIDHNTEAPPDPSEHRPDLPDDVSVIVRRMMEKDPEQRYQTAKELLGDLLVLAKRLNLPCGDAETLVLNPVQVKRSFWDVVLPVLIPSVLLVVAVALLDGIIPNSPMKLPSDPQLVDNRKSVTVPSKGGDSLATKGKANAKSIGTTKTSAKDKKVDAKETSDSRQQSPAGKTNDGKQRAKQRSPRVAQKTKQAVPGAGGISAAGSGGGSLAAVAPDDFGIGSPLANSRIVGSQAAGEIKTLVVGGQEPLPDGYERVTHLVAALQKAKSLRSVSAIELRTNDNIQMTPLEIALKQKDLVIRAGAGYQPVLHFQPAEGNDAFRRSGMISIRQVRVHWQGIQFHLSFAPKAWRDSWSLFEIGRIEKLSFDRCVLTIRNLAKSGKSLHDKVAFISLVAQPTMGMGDMTERPALPVPEIKLTRSIVRGQATMIRAKQAVPFQLNWDQGLFVTNERLVDTGGTADRPKFEDGRAIDIRLQNVTVVAEQGVCRLSMKPDSPYQLDLFTNCTKCIFAIGKDSALYEYVGRETADMLRKPSSIAGNYNFYQAKTVLRLLQHETEDKIAEFVLDETRDRWIAQEKWYNEKSFRAMVQSEWQRGRPTGRSVDQHAPGDYLIVRDGMTSRTGANNNEAAGFDANELPRIRVVVVTPSGA